jgi:hypothetical protein
MKDAPMPEFTNSDPEYGKAPDSNLLRQHLAAVALGRLAYFG